MITMWPVKLVMDNGGTTYGTHHALYPVKMVAVRFVARERAAAAVPTERP